jgi:hypothetical protein
MRIIISVLFSAAAALLTFSPQACATSSRLLSLGLDNWQVEDSANLWHNPARLKASPNQAVLELGGQANSNGALTANTQWGGFTKAIGESVFSLFIRRPYGTADFNNVADPSIFPSLGGFITATNVSGGANLADTNAFGNAGPFGSGAGGSFLGITGATTALPRQLAVPANYCDLFMAVPVGDFTFGGWFNYAGNAPGEAADNSYFSGLGTLGTVKRKRASSEMNFSLGTTIGTDILTGSTLEFVGQFNKPSYELEYRETRTADGAYTSSDIDSRAKMGVALSTRYLLKLEDESSWGFAAHTGSQDSSGKASLATDLIPGGALNTSQSAKFTNTRISYGGDVTWQNPFGKNLLIASIGAQFNKTKQTWLFTDALTPANNHDDYYKVDNLIVPVRIAAEMRPWKVLTVRGGIQKNILATTKTRYRDIDATTLVAKYNTQTAASEASGTNDGVGLSFGMGLNLTDSLTLDGVVRQTLLFHGPYLVGGAVADGTIGGVFARLTLDYRFGLPEVNKTFRSKWK